MDAKAGATPCADRWATPGTPAQPVQWQWEHRTGFKDYEARTCWRIEEAYQRGESHVRLKAGKTKITPMELFFVDMIQHDPVTGNVRRIRRLGPDGWRQRWRRRLGGWWNAMETGRPPRMGFLQYCQMKAKPFTDLDRQSSSEVDLYHQTGCCARIARSSWFSLGTLLAVVLNSLWLGIDANLNSHATIWEADVGFQVAEHIFGAIFLLEIAIRFGGLRRKRDCWRDGWFCFDATLVLLMVGETWVMLPVWLAGLHRGEAGFGDLSALRIVRLLRLTKLGRIARLLRYAPEVRTLLRGVFFAVRSVLVTLALLLVLLYLFGIIFKTQAESSAVLEAKFPGVIASMWFLLLHGTFLDAVSDEVPIIRQESAVLTFLFLVFIFLSSFTILNMLIGILCDVVIGVSRREQERAAVDYLKTNLLEILEVHDKNADRHIRKEEFELLMRNPDVHMILMNFGVDVEDLISLKDVLFDSGEVTLEGMAGETTAGDDLQGPDLVRLATAPEVRKISFGEFMELVLRLRGGNGALVRDIVDLREYVRQRMDTLELQLPGEPRPFAEGYPGPRWGGPGGRGPSGAAAGGEAATPGGDTDGCVGCGGGGVGAALTAAAATPAAAAWGCGAGFADVLPLEGMHLFAAQFADLQKEVRDLRGHLADLERSQRMAGNCQGDA